MDGDDEDEDDDDDDDGNEGGDGDKDDNDDNIKGHNVDEEGKPRTLRQPLRGQRRMVAGCPRSRRGRPWCREKAKDVRRRSNQRRENFRSPAQWLQCL